MFLSHLRLFVELARCKNISQAARACNISQPAASIKIQTIERHYGVQLFSRANRRFELTVAGDIFLETARKILELDDHFRNEINIANRDQREVLKFGASTGPGNYILPPVISKFHEENPSVYLHMIVGDTASILEKVKRGALSFAFIGSRGEQRLTYEILLYDRILLCSNGSDKWPFEIGKDELSNYDLFLEQRGSSSRQVLEAWLDENGISIFSLRCIGELGLPDALKKVVQFGEGLAFLPETLIRDELEKGGLREVFIRDMRPLTRPLYLAYKDENILPDVVRTFISSYLNKL